MARRLQQFSTFLLLSIILVQSAYAKSLMAQRLQTVFAGRGTVLYLEENALYPKNWHHLDFAHDNIAGISSSLAFDNLNKFKPNTEVIVAVIDSGIDVNHEDLNSKIWINKREIPNNGLDDDKNGYIDDVMGWNFLGNKDAMATIEVNLEQGKESYQLNRNLFRPQLLADTLEVTRELKRLETKSAGALSLSTKELSKLNRYREKVTKKRARAKKLLTDYRLDKKVYLGSITALASHNISLENLSLAKLASIQTNNQMELMAIESLKDFLRLGTDIKYLDEQIKLYQTQYEYHYNTNSLQRQLLVDENSKLIREVGYGNNDVIGPDPLHGTHIAGVIAADRTNNLGAKGIAEHVKIMPIRAIPDGDERDKDIINAIYYAVNNGAQIINLSFGKYLSPRQEEVLQAIKYAKKNNVLIVQAAGNDYLNIDVQTSYPYPIVDNEVLPHYITVAASTPNLDETLFAGFSNYGKKVVDVLAPGSHIYSTLPNNKYASMSGTSMAAPIVSGMAAVLLSLAPQLGVEQLKNLILQGVDPQNELTVYKPGVGEVLLSELVNIPGVVNLNKSIKLLLDWQNLALN